MAKDYSVSEKTLHYSALSVGLARLIESLCWPLVAFARRRGPAPLRILIVEPFNLGDAVSLAVMLDPLQRRFPGAEIHLLLKPSGRALYENDPRVARIFTYEFAWAGRGHKRIASAAAWRGFPALWRELRRQHYAIGIDPRGDIRSQALLVLAGCAQRAGYTNYLCSNVVTRGWLLTHSAGALAPQPREAINLAVIAQLGCDVSGPVNRRLQGLTPAPEAPHRTLRLLVHPGGGWAFKLWAEENWRALLQRLTAHYDLQVRLVGEAGERARLERIRQGVSGPVEVRCTSLPELMQEIAAADFVLCLDSGPMHLAAACDKPLLALFGPGYLAVWRPAGAHSQVLHHQEQFPCAPCLQKVCVRPQASCMASITVDEVWALLQDRLPAGTRS